MGLKTATAFVVLAVISLFLNGCSSSSDRPSRNSPPLERANNVHLGAYHYFWYSDEEASSNWNSIPRMYPIRGTYSSSDKENMRGQLELYRRHGLSFMAIEADHPHSLERVETSLFPIWDQGEYRDISFCIFYDIEIWFHHLGIDFSDLNVDTNPTLRLAIALHVSRFSSYMLRENYLRIDGKPVLIIYVSHRLPQRTLQYIREMFALVGEDIYLVGDEAVFHRVDNTYLFEVRLDLGVFNAVTSYNQYGGAGIPVFPVYHKQAAGAVLALEREVGYFSGCTVTYDDSGVPGRTYRPLNPQTAEDVEVTLTSCLDNVYALPHSEDGYMIFTSFNEWYENTSIEPSRERGSLILDTLSSLR